MTINKDIRIVGQSDKMDKFKIKKDQDQLIEKEHFRESVMWTETRWFHNSLHKEVNRPKKN